MLKNFIFFFLGAVFMTAMTVWAVNPWDASPQSGTKVNIPSHPSATTKSVSLPTATTTYTKIIPVNTVYVLDSELGGQGVCVKIKDSDGDGFTYLTVNNGVGKFNLLSCE